MTTTANSRPRAPQDYRRKQAADKSLDEGVTIMVDGTAYTVVAGDLSALDTMALRRETGFSFRSLILSLQTDPDVDLVAALVWLARRTNGEQMLTFAEVASEIGYDADIDVKEAEEPDPEA